MHPAWQRLPWEDLQGLVMVIGAPDTGKSTFARYLYERLAERHYPVAFLDGDVGQAKLGPPTTMTVALSRLGDTTFPPRGPVWRAFVGDVSPRGHMLRVLVGAHQLVHRARRCGAKTIVFDTTGLIAPQHGGGELKHAKIGLLRPTAVIGLQRAGELEHILLPLRRGQYTRVFDLPVSRAVCPRDPMTRRAYRAARFHAYFQTARVLELPWQSLAIFPCPNFPPHRLLALEDRDGFALGLGIVLNHDPTSGLVRIWTPLATVEGVNALRLGDLVLDPETFVETRLCVGSGVAAGDSNTGSSVPRQPAERTQGEDECSKSVTGRAGGRPG